MPVRDAGHAGGPGVLMGSTPTHSPEWPTVGTHASSFLILIPRITLCRRFYHFLFADKAIDFQGK